MFKNATIFRIAPGDMSTPVRLDQELQQHVVRDPGPMETAARGFISPLGESSEQLQVQAAGLSLVIAADRHRMLPPAIIDKELIRRCDAITADEGRNVRGRERKRIREEVVNELLPKAFVKSSTTRVILDWSAGVVIVNTASKKAAESAISQIRMVLGSFPAVPLAPTKGPRVLLTDWLANGCLPTGLSLGDECELRDPATTTGAIARCRRQDLDGDEVKEHLRNGKQVFQLGLAFEDRISFVLGEDLVLRKLKFLDAVEDERADGVDMAIESDLALYGLEIRRLFGRLSEIFAIQDVDA